jgi:transcriptional regulator with XRE-family HTH domain
MSNDNVFVGYDSVFATRLRELMEANKTTQKDLAEIVGTTRQAISQYADGSVQPNIEKLYKMASYFGVSSDWLIGKNDIQSHDVDDIAINKKLGLTQEAIEELSFLSSNVDLDPPIERRLKTINFLLSDDESKHRTGLLGDIADYLYASQILEICKNAHYHLDNVVQIGDGKETDLGAHIISNFLREEDVLNMLLIKLQKTLVKSMELVRGIDPASYHRVFGGYDMKKDCEENGGEK